MMRFAEFVEEGTDESLRKAPTQTPAPEAARIKRQKQELRRQELQQRIRKTTQQLQTIRDSSKDPRRFPGGFRIF